ncbi:hypothetical protein AVEN_132445-1 [Araneus ventricosus]|uniref:Uncharacterized protein n=1 Tax=Araneus ventricosus TaxID=182803 RepID=A0A4Y2JTG2_ARAVE|nr:hypothetical protein AVEN_132445-1 [Araneus ventricosus]
MFSLSTCPLEKYEYELGPKNAVVFLLSPSLTSKEIPRQDLTLSLKVNPSHIFPKIWIPLGKGLRWTSGNVSASGPDGSGHLSERRTNLLAEITSCPLSQFSTTIFTSLSEENLVLDKCLEPTLGAESGLCVCGEGCIQTSHLNFSSDSWVLRSLWVLSCKRMTPSLNIPGRLRRITLRWLNDYFLFPKLKEHLSGSRFSSENDVKTVAENWLNGQDVISAKPVKQVVPAFR